MEKGGSEGHTDGQIRERGGNKLCNKLSEGKDSQQQNWRKREKESKGKMRERKVSCNQAGVFPVYVSFCFSFSSITIFFYICLLHMYFTLCYKLACCKAVKCSHWVAYYSVTLQTTSLTLISTKLSKKSALCNNVKFKVLHLSTFQRNTF